MDIGFVGGKRHRGGTRSSLSGRSDRSDALTGALSAIDVSLSEGLVCGRIQEIIRTTGGTVFDEEIAAFDATVVVVEKLTFRVEELGALLAWNRGNGR